ncbi:hypothetical protein [Campylobacter concisus]|mgnify:CR=1 FL=1|jgi:hypothetical protein|uniref:hypothetical protein n=1 Tax=Campylobacter concisus TaxID=199 RepID=UPI000D38134A|nr:hypothetical protein [Campylobacter concisus]
MKDANVYNNLIINNESIDIKPHINIYKEFENKAQKILKAQKNTDSSNMLTEPQIKQVTQNNNETIITTKD